MQTTEVKRRFETGNVLEATMKGEKTNIQTNQEPEISIFLDEEGTKK